MRTAAKTDGNHGQIVKALRDFPGIAVLSLAALGKGCPDLLVAFRGVTCLLEVKQPGKKPNAGQIKFIADWPGLVYVVSSGDEAVRVVVEAARPSGVPPGTASADYERGPGVL
jgi:hypothetical protein